MKILLLLLVFHIHGSSSGENDVDAERDEYFEYYTFKENFGEVSKASNRGSLSKPSCLGGNIDRQSPIDIGRWSARPVNCPCLELCYFQGPRTFSLANTENKLELFTLDRTNVEKPFVRGGPLKPTDNYVFENLHLHWSQGSNDGSEHAIDGIKYAAELHLVCFNSKYRNFRTAAEQPDGLVVLAVLLQESPADYSVLDPLLSLGAVVGEKAGSRVNFTGDFPFLFLKELVKDANYFFYLGSLTSPPFQESPTFIVFERPMMVSANTLRILRRFKDEAGNTIRSNARELQPRGTREIFYCT